MYNVRKVTDDLWWVGANDRRTALFENIYPIPRGVSYNSYLLLDEKAVLFDTVDASAVPQLMENLEHLLGDRELDYIVIHHLEPDHAAGLRAVLERWPQAMVVGGVLALRFMEQFGYTPAKKQAVKEGETLSFGRHSLTFYAAGMVHWPEVMVSYDPTIKALFSADAFGTFGALNGRLFQDEWDLEGRWLPEGRRYYTNIVGKYGPNVQAVLKKLSGLDIGMICPLHGPVWRGDLDWLLGKYDKWSRYEPEEKGVLIVYGSMYGNTEQAADILAGDLTERGVETALYDASSTPVSLLVAETFRFSHVILASPTYNMDLYPPIHEYLSHLKLLEVKGRTFALVENGTWMPKSGEKMAAFVTGELKNCPVLEPCLTMKSILPQGRAQELEAFSDRVAQSVHTV